MKKEVLMKDVLNELNKDFNGEMSVKMKDDSAQISINIEDGGVHCLATMVVEVFIAFHEWLEENTEYSKEGIRGKFHEIVDIAISLKESRRQIEVLSELETKIKELAKEELMYSDKFAEATDMLIKCLATVHGIAKEDAKNGR